MAMDYGSGAAPNGATGMDGYAIASAQATRAQLQPIFPSATIGITPIVGQNDVRDEIFSLQDATQLLKFAQANSWISLLSFWSINRDTSVFSSALYASSGIKQNMFDFANIMSAYETSTPTTPVVIPSTPFTPPAPKLPLPNIPGMYNWPALVFALTVDTTGPNAVNLATMSNTAGTSMYNLGYMIADATNSPSWGGLHSLSDSWYLSQIQQIRNFGGDVMISFGGPNGQELAQVITSASKLKTQYQNVIDSYSISWLDFNLQGASLLDQASIDVRNVALRGLQTVFPNLRITCTLPATPTGSSDAMYVLTSAYNAGVRVDVANVLAIPSNTGITLDPAVTLCAHTINAVQAAYTQAKATGLAYFSMGTTPVIGTEEYADATFSANDAIQILLFAQSNTWVTLCVDLNCKYRCGIPNHQRPVRENGRKHSVASRRSYVRTYPNDYAPSDTESEGEAQFEVEVEDEEQNSVSTRFEQNQLYMDRQITAPSGETSAWVLEPQTWKTTEGTDVVLIRKPTASNLSHRLLNPFIYRNIQNLPEVSMFISIQDQKQRSLLAESWPDINMISAVKTDPHFLDTEGRNLIASEATTHRTFPPGEMWRFSLEESMKTATLDESVPQINETPEKTVIKPRILIHQISPTIQSARLQQAARLESGKKTPSFVSGYANGQPIYTTVRVVPQDIVAGIEDEIAIQERKEYQKAN
ncbi:hypothetical protein BASA83_011082 [Batrachochytrium salamandrivorans]|nr:hypothetical protein BASA83_011082 [Batrachochytrium salamandrivorans]